MARDGDNFMKAQLHRVALDGKNDKRLTDPAFTHQIDLSPDGKYFIDVAQTHDQAPVSRVIEVSNGKVVGELAKSDVSLMEQRGLRKRRCTRTWPLTGDAALRRDLVPVQLRRDQEVSRADLRLWRTGGGSQRVGGLQQRNAQTEYGFIVVGLSSRAAPGMGKRTLDAIYLRLGQPRWTTWPRGSRRCGRVRTSTRIASASTARRTADTRGDGDSASS